MNPWEYELIQKLTGRIQEKAARQGTAEDKSHQVRQVDIYGWIFWAGLLFGLLVGGVCFLFRQWTAGLCFWLLFGLLAVPGLCVQYNCRLTYDEEGFTWQNLFRLCRRYSYEEVTGLYSSPTRVVVELNGGKQLDLDAGWINREDFARAVRKYRSQKPPKLAAPVLGMSEAEIAASYENGTLAKALLVTEADLPRFGRFKALHYGIGTLCSLSAAFAVFCGPAFLGTGRWTGLLFLGLPGILLMAAAIFLYFHDPQYFTAREKPAAQILCKKDKVRHKRCTMVLTSLLSLPGGCIFFLCRMEETGQRWPLWLALAAAGLLFAALLALFRRFSWEYRKFRVGYGSFGVYQAMFSLTVFFVLGGLLLF